MKPHIFAAAACGVVLLGSALIGCGSKPETASSSPTGTANSDMSSAAASYNNTNSPQGQRYQQAIQQSGSTKSPYSR